MRERGKVCDVLNGKENASQCQRPGGDKLTTDTRMNDEKERDWNRNEKEKKEKRKTGS